MTLVLMSSNYVGFLYFGNEIVEMWKDISSCECVSDRVAWLDNCRRVGISRDRLQTDRHEALEIMRKMSLQLFLLPIYGRTIEQFSQFAQVSFERAKASLKSEHGKMLQTIERTAKRLNLKMQECSPLKDSTRFLQPNRIKQIYDIFC